MAIKNIICSTMYDISLFDISNNLNDLNIKKYIKRMFDILKHAPTNDLCEIARSRYDREKYDDFIEILNS